MEYIRVNNVWDGLRLNIEAHVSQGEKQLFKTPITDYQITVLYLS